MNITICTPTYNRGNLLGKLYESLKKQNYKSFQWLIIDDGSIDNTEEIVAQFIKEIVINIRYIKKENGGKHTALNLAIDEAEGELFWIVDSDDYIADDSLNYMWDQWNNIKDKSEFAGISGLRGYENGKVIGNTYEGEMIDTDALNYRYKYRIQGDKAEIYRTCILRQFKFPVFEGERYITESVVWNRIANKNLKLRYLNKVTYICEYLNGGLTNTSDKNIMDSWKGTTLYYKEMLSYKQIPMKEKIFNTIRSYVHYCYEKNLGVKEVLKITHNGIYIFSGIIIYILKVIKRKYYLMCK